MKIVPVTNSAEAQGLLNLPSLAIDLGFAEKRASCGLSEHQAGFKFSSAVEACAKWLARQGAAVVIILEAPLSGSFDKNGNPCARGRFETHHSLSGESSARRWQSGPGASMSLAALYFLRKLSELTAEVDVTMHLVEGFCSRYGDTKPSDTAVANELLRLWRAGAPLVETDGATKLSALCILDAGSTKIPPAILCVSDGFC